MSNIMIYRETVLTSPAAHITISPFPSRHLYVPQDNDTVTMLIIFGCHVVFEMGDGDLERARLARIYILSFVKNTGL